MPFLEGPALASLLARMAATAAFVIAVALLSERTGPFLGAMAASLPIYTGPVYLFLALEHGTDYLAEALIGSTAISAATPVFALAYCKLAQRRGLALSLSLALVAWAVTAITIRTHQWTQAEAVLLCLVMFAVAVPASAHFKHAAILAHAPRAWIDLPLRAAMIAVLVGLVTSISRYTPPQLTGILSVVPILFSSIILVLHPRIGGPATAALMAHTLGGLIGMVIAFTVVHFTIRSLGTAPALLIGLGICIAWNLMLIFIRHGRLWLRR